MLRPACEVPIPEVHVDDIAGAALRLEQMTAQELPAFVIHEAGFSLLAAAERLRPVFESQHYSSVLDGAEAAGFMTKENVFPSDVELTDADYDEYNYAARDVAFHFDKLPSKSLTHVTHLTTQGEAKVQLFEPTPNFFATVDARSFRLDDEIDALLRSGFVTDELFSPNNHTTIVRPGSLLFFRLGGLVPLVHDFTTIKAPRGAEIADIVHVQPIS